jgi:2'-5' RNA ligase
MVETAIVVTVDAAEPAVARFRRAHTPSGTEGMPAHVTLMCPFADSELLTGGMVRNLREEFSRFRSFTFSLPRLDRFDGPTTVLYAVPAPREPFVELTEALIARFGFLPYEGEHADVVPHLTIASSDDPAVLAATETEVARSLPITAAATSAEVWEHRPDAWRMIHRFPLAPAER